MATVESVSRLFDQLRPRERLTLVLEAMARGDEPEAKRLRGSCPRKTYTMSDAEFSDRLEMSCFRMTVVCIDLRCAWGELKMLEHVIEWLPEADGPYRRAAGLSFLQGIRYGRGKPPFTFSPLRMADPEEAEATDGDATREDATQEGATDDETSDAEGADSEELHEFDREENEGAEDLEGRLAAAVNLAGEATQALRQILATSAELIAKVGDLGGA